MKKKIICTVLIVVVLASVLISVNAGQDDEIKAADALNELGLFLGTGVSYELDENLSRVQGVTLLVRMIGKESEALEKKEYNTPFIDVPDWAVGYVGYAYTNHITNGTGADVFGSDENITDYMFLTLTLRALGYTDSGENPQFVWDDPYELAYEAGLINKTVEDKDFTRGDAVIVFWNALGAKIVGTDKTLAESLIENGVFNEDVYITAQNIREDGRSENPGVPMIPKETEPKETEPKETEPEETEPKETEPEETEPKETEPEETEPKETEPEETEPKETEPKETEPKETEPEETEPKETEPEETEPKETEPEETEPENNGVVGGEAGGNIGGSGGIED